jgi:hypothetical protein
MEPKRPSRAQDSAELHDDEECRADGEMATPDHHCQRHYCDNDLNADGCLPVLFPHGLELQLLIG